MHEYTTTIQFLAKSGEGKKREVRMLLDAAGLKTISLARIRLGGLHLGPLPLGSWRALTEKEKELIFS